MAYDIIGDIHGQDGKLTALLAKLGYRIKDGAYRHPEGHMALFLGDLIDRGPGQLEVINIVRTMIEAGSGRTIMGNHEWNAIRFVTRDAKGNLVKERDPDKTKEHAAFLEQVGGEGTNLHNELIGWFKTLPPFLQLDGIQVCHAWWKPESIDVIRSGANDRGVLSEDFLFNSFIKRTPAWRAIEDVTKGYEVKMGNGASFLDHNGIPRKEVRVRWWDESADTYRKAALVPQSERNRIPDIPLPEEVKLGATSNVPTFVGHYWLTGTPGVQNATTAVLDYGAALKGPLVAYRWDGEPVLTNDNFVWVSPGGQND
jgi:hypothetical protein